MATATTTTWWLWPTATVHHDLIAQSDVAPAVEVDHSEPAAPVEPVVEVSPAVQPSLGGDAAIDEAVIDAPIEASIAKPVDPRPEEPESAVPPTTAAPALPLPRMPGDTKLSTSSRFDEENNAWIVKAAYRVVAREHHVVAFYRKALTDQGLTVTHSQAQPGADGSVKTYLHGKNGRVHAQIGIAPRIDVLETRVWILWRTRA